MSRKKKIAGDGSPPPDGQSAGDFSPVKIKRIMAQTRHVNRERTARQLAKDFLALEIPGKKGVRTIEELIDQAYPLRLAERIQDNPPAHVREMLFLALTLAHHRASREPKPGEETPLDFDLMQRREQAELYRKAIEAGEAFEATLERIPWTLHVELLKPQGPDSSKKSMDELSRARKQSLETLRASLMEKTERLASECEKQPPKYIESILEKALADAFSKAMTAAASTNWLLPVVPESLRLLRESLTVLREGKEFVGRVLSKAEKKADAGKAKHKGQPPKWEALFVILARWVAINLAAKFAPDREAVKKAFENAALEFCAQRSEEIFGQRFTAKGVKKRLYCFDYNAPDRTGDFPALKRLRAFHDHLVSRMKWHPCEELNKQGKR